MKLTNPVKKLTDAQQQALAVSSLAIIISIIALVIAARKRGH